MPPTQITIPGVPFGPLEEAITNVRSLSPTHANFDQCVKELTSKIMGRRPGSVILCAAPSDIGCDEIIAAVREDLEACYKARASGPFPGVRIVSAPSELRRGRGAAGLIRSYQHPVESPDVAHRFALFPGEAFNTRDEFQRISSLVKMEAPAVCFFRNAHALETTRGGIDDAVNAVRTLAEIAYSSGCTHVLIGHTRVVLGWLKRTEIVSSVTAIVLSPYDLKNEVDKANFVEVLRAYDGLVNLKDDCLENHLDDIDEAIAGSPHRLRNWIEDALHSAQAAQMDHLDWAQMWKKRPRNTPRVDACKERDEVLKYLRDDDEPSGSDAGGDQTSTAPRNRNPGTPPPGNRKPNRNSYAA